jgi:hypothetical protein
MSLPTRCAVAEQPDMPSDPEAALDQRSNQRDRCRDQRGNSGHGAPYDERIDPSLHVDGGLPIGSSPASSV